MKKQILPLLILITGILNYSCRDDNKINKIPEAKETYIFSFKSEVDAEAIGCGYVNYEKVGDWIKKKIQQEVPFMSTKQLISLGEYFHKNQINFPITEHGKSDWAVEIIDKMKPFLVENEFPYKVYTVSEPSFNAFTIPGGNIYVTTGLLDSVKNKDELAYVIGHELGHNENDHTKELARLYKYVELKEKEGGFWNLSVAFITQVASSICGKPDELECDISSMYLLQKAGYDPEKALGAIALLRKTSSPRPDGDWKAMFYAFFRTHPWSEDRDNCVSSYVKNAKVRAECEKVFNNTKGVLETNISSLDIKEYPINKSKSLKTIPEGAEMEIICDCVEQKYRKDQDWIYISYEEDGEEVNGWVEKKYIKFIENVN